MAAKSDINKTFILSSCPSPAGHVQIHTLEHRPRTMRRRPRLQRHSQGLAASTVQRERQSRNHPGARSKLTTQLLLQRSRKRSRAMRKGQVVDKDHIIGRKIQGQPVTVGQMQLCCCQTLPPAQVPIEWNQQDESVGAQCRPALPPPPNILEAGHEASKVMGAHIHNLNAVNLPLPRPRQQSQLQAQPTAAAAKVKQGAGSLSNHRHQPVCKGQRDLAIFLATPSGVADGTEITAAATV